MAAARQNEINDNITDVATTTLTRVGVLVISIRSFYWLLSESTDGGGIPSERIVKDKIAPRAFLSSRSLTWCWFEKSPPTRFRCFQACVCNDKQAQSFAHRLTREYETVLAH